MLFFHSIHNYEIRLMIREYFIKIPAVLSNIYFVKLQKKLSISVPLQVVNLVGRVIWGKRLKMPE